MKLASQNIISCILPKGIAINVVKQLRESYSGISANINNARGVGKITPLAYRGVGEQSEKEILTVTVPSEQADDIFEFIYITADINRPRGGMMYMHTLHKSTEFKLPDIPQETGE